MTTVRELRALLLDLDQGAVVTTWDDILASECHIRLPLEVSQWTVRFDSSGNYVTEEDVS